MPIEKWDTTRKEEVLKALEKYAKKRHVSISSNAWEKYIKGKPTTSRNKAFMLAFALRLNIDTTLKLLRGLQLGECSIDNPLDVVCLFCQSKQEWYCWANVETIMNRVETVLKTGNHKDTPVMLNTIQPSANMTHQIAAKLEEIFEESLPETDAKCELIDYMVEHNSEFPRFKTTTVEPYLPGYSLSRMEEFLRLTDFLAVLYPEYLIINKDSIFKNETKPIECDPNGTLLLSSLAKAMFQDSEWRHIIWGGSSAALPSDNMQYISVSELSKKWAVSEKQILKYCNQERISGAIQSCGTWLIPENINKPSEFEDRMYELCSNYEQHLDAIDRLRRDENSVEFFERRDALLFIYFLINGYIKLVQRSTMPLGKARSLIEEILGFSSEEKTKQAIACIEAMLNCGNDLDRNDN